jgi:site-specific DNA recombinase
LNKDRISAPGGGDWGSSTINGNAKRGNGILNNEMYIGRIVWNRQRFINDPETGKRQARPNPEAEWIVQEVPELRIIDGKLWDAAKARQAAIKTRRGEGGNKEPNSFRDRRRPKYIFSGLIKCASCGGGYAMISTDLIGCSTARNKGTCDNRRSIQRVRVEGRVLNAPRHHLMDPTLFKEFCDEFTREMNRLRMEGSALLAIVRSEVKKIDRELGKLLNLILRGGAADTINAKMVQLEGRKAELERQLTDAESPPPLLHPEMATFYREQVNALHQALQDDTEATRLQAGEILRSLVKEIILPPEAGELKIDVRGRSRRNLGDFPQNENPVHKDRGFAS